MSHPASNSGNEASAWGTYSELENAMTKNCEAACAKRSKTLRKRMKQLKKHSLAVFDNADDDDGAMSLDPLTQCFLPPTPIALSNWAGLWTTKMLALPKHEAIEWASPQK